MEELNQIPKDLVLYNLVKLKQLVNPIYHITFKDIETFIKNCLQ